MDLRSSFFFKGLLLFIKDDFFFAEDNSFDESGIGYQIVINPLKNIHQIWKVDTTEFMVF